jgi:hypothetical protein
MADARVFGVIEGTPEQPRVSYLKKEAIVDLAHLPPLDGLQPGHIFRIAAICEKGLCKHFTGQSCSLAKRIVDQLPPVVDALPPCQIRPSCRWYAEQRAAACHRCPQVVTFASTDMVGLVGVASAREGQA